MSRRTYKPADYEPCPVGCGKQRWRGASLPVCSFCQNTVMDIEWLRVRQRLVHSNASLDVILPFDQALVADCKERQASQQSAKPFRIET